MPDPQDLLTNAGEAMQGFTDQIIQDGLSIFLMKLLVALLIVIIGRWVAKWLANAVSKALGRRNPDPTLLNFVNRAVYALGLAIVFVSALAYIGIPTTSIIAVLGAFSLAVGLALQDSLSNLASGLLIIILRPYKAGEFVEVGSERLTGIVMEILFFHTLLRRVDNSVILVPNSDVMGNPILNFTDMEWRRIDLEFGIDYGDDLLKAKEIMQQIVAEDPRIAEDPPPRIAVSSLGDNSVNLVMQPYVKPVDYLDTKFHLTEQVKLRFDEAGITIPFPQRTIHVVTNGTPELASTSESVKTE